MRTKLMTWAIGRRARAAVLSGLGALTIAALAFASIPSAEGTIHGCYNTANGDLRVIDDATEVCHPGETDISWSQSGIVGYEVVAETAAAPPGVGMVVRARCTAGKKVLGGGYHTNSLRVSQNFPQLSGPEAPSWQVFVHNDTASTLDVTAYAICAQASPRGPVIQAALAPLHRYTGKELVDDGSAVWARP